MKKLLIFGGNGFVGGHIARQGQQNGWEVWSANRSLVSGICGIYQQVIDITDREATKKFMAELRPEAVVNVAAVADIDRAERERETAWRINVDGALNLAEASAEFKARHIYFSSDAVFDGKSAGYREEDLPNPVNYYGYTKAEAEKVVMSAHPGAVALRISLVLGFPVFGAGNCFLAGLVVKLREGREVFCDPDQYRTPVDVITLSECILELLTHSFTGILHLGALDSINRYELTKKAAVLMGYPECLIKKQEISGEGAPKSTPRHKNGILIVEKARGLLSTRLLDADQTIRRAVGKVDL